MSSVAAEVGIDVSSDRLDVSVDEGRPFRVANTPEGCKALAERLPKGAVVHLEASGGYERIARRTLTRAGFEVRTHDPLKVRRRAQSDGRRAKTDALDAVSLSRDGGSLRPQQEKSCSREEACDLSRTIEALKSTAAQMKVRARVPGLDAFARKELSACACDLNRRAKIMEKEALRRLKTSSLAHRYELAVSVEGVGPCLGRVVCCELPESIEPYTDPQLTSYSGVAPIDDTSGNKKGPARIGKGNSHLKAALYMPAVGCLRHQPWAKDLYARLRARGRVHQQAIVAVMRRLLLRILEVIRRGTPWILKQRAT
jgi:transposase